jgi:ribonuclease HI
MRVVFLREIMKECYYAVARGWEVGIYRTWTECKKITDGFPNARFKKFGTEKEAREFIEINGNNSSMSMKVYIEI